MEAGHLRTGGKLVKQRGFNCFDGFREVERRATPLNSNYFELEKILVKLGRLGIPGEL
jgi:hypothetical protein